MIFSWLKLFFDPKIALAVILVVAVSAGWSYRLGVKHTENSIETEMARTEQLAQAVYDAAISATASEISKIEIVNKTIQQELEREVRTETIYVDCRHTDDTKRLLDAILTGERPAESFDRSKLPAINSVSR